MRSMAFGEPDKLTQAKRIIAALASMALCGLDRVEITVFREGLADPLPPCRGKVSIFRIFDNYMRRQGGLG